MGCLFNFLFLPLKLLFHPIELIGYAIIDGWVDLMSLVVPARMRSRALRTLLKVLVSVWTAILFLTMFIGIWAIISDDPYTHRVGMYMVFVPLALSAVQITVGVIVKIIQRKHNGQ